MRFLVGLLAFLFRVNRLLGECRAAVEICLDPLKSFNSHRVIFGDRMLKCFQVPRNTVLVRVVREDTAKLSAVPAWVHLQPLLHELRTELEEAVWVGFREIGDELRCGLFVGGLQAIEHPQMFVNLLESAALFQLLKLLTHLPDFFDATGDLLTQGLPLNQRVAELCGQNRSAQFWRRLNFFQRGFDFRRKRPFAVARNVFLKN